jgi:hypothetical protein
LALSNTTREPVTDLRQDNDHDIIISNDKVAIFAANVAWACCTKGGSKALSGMAFSAEGFNVDVGYANCNHEADHDHPGDFQPPYLNGACST